MKEQLDHVSDYDNIKANVKIALIIRDMALKYGLDYSTDVDIYLKDNLPMVMPDAEYADVITHDGNTMKDIVCEIYFNDEDCTWKGIHRRVPVERHANLWMEV